MEFSRLINYSNLLRGRGVSIENNSYKTRSFTVKLFYHKIDILKDCTKLRNSTKGFRSPWKMNKSVTIYQLNNKYTNCNVLPVSLDCFKRVDGTIHKYRSISCRMVFSILPIKHLCN